MKKYLLLLALTIGFLSCSDDPVIDNEVKDIINNEIVLFSGTETPAGLSQLYSNSKILLFGETHYVQEHHEYLVSQLPALHDAGYRIIFDELFHSFSWMVNDYVRGEVDVLPEFILFFHAEILNGIREFNSTLPDAEKFELRYMDVNHWDRNFLASIDEIEREIGAIPEFDDLRAAFDNKLAYQGEIDRLKIEFNRNSNLYITAWGQKWYDIIREITEVEAGSSNFRLTGDFGSREQIMLDNITNYLAANGDKKVLVNTGSDHAQKEVFSGPTATNRLGNLLESSQSDVNAVIFLGIKGQKKSQFFDEENSFFDLSAEVTEGDAMKTMIDAAAGSQFMMPLSNSKFSNTDIKITYQPGGSIAEPIGRQFDAIIAYPTISTLRSMEDYDWQ